MNQNQEIFIHEVRYDSDDSTILYEKYNTYKDDKLVKLKEIKMETTSIMKRQPKKKTPTKS